MYKKYTSLFLFYDDIFFMRDKDIQCKIKSFHKEMVACFSPFVLRYFSIKYVNTQDKNAGKRDNYVYMQHNYVNMLDICKQIKFT